MLKSILSAFVLISIFAGSTISADKKIILPPMIKSGGTWSPGILIDGTLYISGMSGEDSQGKIPDNFEAEVKRSLDKVGVVLKEAGMGPEDVVSVQIYLTDHDLFDRMNTIYTSYFKDPRPARTTVIVSKLVGPGHIEITVTAKR